MFKMNEDLKVIETVFHSDCGHGWVEVPISVLKEFKIASKISEYSYKKNGIAYLEEDCDLSTFMNACRDRGFKIKFDEVYDGDDSFIRGLPCYK